ncbi:MAG TPA: class I SAM-dependent methyltransferase [Pyrinomonadaceae bacterium]|nr:class I SAM-dependent methyltransferase [Pyrinomonadaceae bacterium]
MSNPKPDVRDVQEWWAENPMTYGATHGQTEYADARYEAGSREFFERLDREFYSWNTPLHEEGRPFGRLFPYDLYGATHARVLEVGCGLGTMAMNWARQGARVTAVDLNPTSIEMTRKRFALHQLEGEIGLADARSLPLPDEAFDYVYSWGVLHHSPNLEQSINELMRVLRPGGGFGIMLYNRRSILYWYSIKYLQGYLHYEDKFLKPLELASRYGDGDTQEGNPHTWPVTSEEAAELLRPHSRDVQVKRLGTELDNIFRQMLPFVGRAVPRVARKAWARRYGWSLWIHGHKN